MIKLCFEGSGSVVQELDITDPLFQVQQQYRHETLLESSHQGDSNFYFSFCYPEEE